MAKLVHHIVNHFDKQLSCKVPSQSCEPKQFLNPNFFLITFYPLSLKDAQLENQKVLCLKLNMC